MKLRIVAFALCASAFGLDVVAAEPYAPLRYALDIEAPRALKSRLERDLDLVRWQTYADITPELLDLLVEQAKSQATDIAATEGYFSPTVSATLDKSQEPPKVTISLQPGPPTKIASVALDVTGAGADDVDAAPQIEHMREAWSLPTGATFRQADWDAAKAGARRTLAAKRYAGARVAASQADIDPERLAAALSMTLETGPPYRLGVIRVHGTSKYRDAFVRNLSGFANGDPYDSETLDQFTRRLNRSGYFASAQAVLDTDPATADAAPVDVTVIEAPSKRLSVGAGFSTDTLYRGQLTYNDYNLDHDGLQLLTDLRVEGKEQSASLRLQPPPNARGDIDGYEAQLAHTDIAGLATQEITGGWQRRTLDERRQSTFAASYTFSRSAPTNAESYSAHALYLENGYARRTVDDLILPTRGTIVATRIGVGVPGASTAPFVRGIVQAMYWVPIDPKTGFSLRGEAGAVFVNDRHHVPASLAFRLGGDTTVRGYAYQSLGPREGDATVPGRYYGLASAELVRWITPVLGAAVFVDAGNATDEVRDFKPVYGYGVGARIRTPVGPFRVDLAYGSEARTVRLHLSVGLSF